MDNLSSPPQPPPDFTASPNSIVDDTRRLIEQLRDVQRQVVEDVDPGCATFANVILPLAHRENAAAAEIHVLLFYRYVSRESELREASRKAQNLWDEFRIDTAMNEGLFKLVDAVLGKGEELDPESLLLLKKKHKNHVKSGLALPPGPMRDRYRTIQGRLSQLTTQFRENLAKVGGIWLSASELQGVPQSVLTRLKNGKGDNQGKLRVTFSPADFVSVMRYADSEQTRRRLFMANDNQCDQNIALFREAVILRDEAARLLGYSSHAAFRIEDKMAGTTETVDGFLKDLKLRLKDGGRQEVSRLKELKKEDVVSRGQSFDERYWIWDHSYYHRLMLEEQYSVNHQQIAEYFPVGTTVAGMLKMVQHLFGLKFREVRVDSDNTWHPDVQVFSAWDSEELGGGFVGYLYLDLYAREGKTSGAANFNLMPGFFQGDDTRHFPATVLLCSFRNPSTQSPSLLRHDEVVTLFHELGHAIHDLVAKVRYACFHGTETAVDFGEAPSQMLEYWCWDPAQLKSLSQHYSSLPDEYVASGPDANGGQPILPPEQIPDHLVDALIKSKHVNQAYAYLNQLCIGLFDMAIHEPESHGAVEDMNMSATFNKIRSQVLPLDTPEKLGLGFEWGHPQARLTHLMGEYDAGYYAYLFSKVLAADMFHTFFEGDLDNCKTGIRYRRSLLEKGGSQDEMMTATNFLGRKPSMQPFDDELGLT